MSIKKPLRLAVALLVATAAVPALAQETKGKFRFSLHMDYVSISDEIRSNSNNTITFDQDGTGLVSFTDPRNDRAEEKSATIDDGSAVGLTVDYGLTGWKWAELQLEGSVTHFNTDVSDLEVSYLVVTTVPLGTGLANFFYPRCTNPPFCQYGTYPTTIGELTWDQPQVGAKLRFRPTKQFAPYLGAGVGYYLVDFERSKQIDQMSENLEHSSGTYVVYDPKTFKQSVVTRSNGFRGIEVEADDAFEYHFQAGVEYTFAKWKRRWTIFLEGRYFYTDGDVRITTDGREEFGQSFPEDARGVPKKFLNQLTDIGYPVSIEVGGLMDITSAKPDPKDPSRVIPAGRDGVLDPGLAFIQGGTIKYGGYHFDFGFRFTF